VFPVNGLTSATLGAGESAAATRADVPRAHDAERDAVVSRNDPVMPPRAPHKIPQGEGTVKREILSMGARPRGATGGIRT
jgi:hypothetical protein